MDERKFTVELIHGELSPEERNQIISSFKKGDSRVLITTDVLARGIGFLFFLFFFFFFSFFFFFFFYFKATF